MQNKDSFLKTIQKNTGLINNKTMFIEEEYGTTTLVFSVTFDNQNKNSKSYITHHLVYKRSALGRNETIIKLKV